MIRDQATELRELMQRRKVLVEAPPRSDGPRKLLLVAGGLSGVGTTTVAIQLAAALARRGGGCLLADVDPRGGDLATRCGVRPERAGLEECLNDQKTLDDLVIEAKAGLRIVSGWMPPDDADPAMAWNELTASEDAGRRLIGALRTGLTPESARSTKPWWASIWGAPERHATAKDAAAGADQGGHAKQSKDHGGIPWAVLDVGNQWSTMTRRLWQAVDASLLVVSPETDAILSGYARIKAVSQPALAAPIYTLVNRSDSQQQFRDVAQRLEKVAGEFLGLAITESFSVDRSDDYAEGPVTHRCVFDTIAGAICRTATAEASRPEPDSDEEVRTWGPFRLAWVPRW